MTTTATPAPRRALTVLNETGDVTLVWTEESDARMEALIRRGMAEGVTFFIIEPRLGGLAPPTRTRLEDSTQARRYRAVAVADEDMGRLVAEGAATTVRTPRAPVRRSRVSRDAAEVARSESVAVKRKRGG